MAVITRVRHRLIKVSGLETRMDVEVLDWSILCLATS